MWRIRVLCILAALFVAVGARAENKIAVLLITGQNNHNWKATTPIIQEELKKAGKFKVDVITTPARAVPPSEWNSFRPNFAHYRVVFVNYNGDIWPIDVQKSFEKYMAAGGGLVIYHASNNPFPKWTEWHKMVGLCWQGPNFGDRIIVNEVGKVMRTPKGQGPGAGHGAKHPFEMVVRDSQHPIMKGLPLKWLHTTDELYHGQRGPAVNMHILATAFSAVETKGTGADEPLVWVVKYGAGRVFVCLLGHDEVPTSNPDTATLLTRGTEWAATGKVTLPPVAGFPGKVVEPK